MPLRELVEYQGRDGNSSFAKWLVGVNAAAAAKITVALYRMQQGNFSNVKSVGKGVSEYKIDFGPGYRVYFGQDGECLIILLSGGSKKTQNKDIKLAHAYWADYKARKKVERG